MMTSTLASSLLRLCPREGPSGWVVVAVLASSLYLRRRLRKRKSAPLVRNAFALARSRFRLELSPAPEHMEGQLGGLAHAETRSMLVSGSFVLKPVQSETRGLREVSFYEYCALRSSVFAPFLCTYHGVVDFQGHPYVALDDCRRGMRRPCTLDVKIGTRTYEDDAPREKRDREAAKYPPQAALGCRIVGMRIATGSTFATYDKHYGYGLRNEDDLLRAFRRYFEPKKAAVQAFLAKLNALRAVFEANAHPLVFVSSSLFFVYDAAADSVELRLIDFAHVRYDARRDDGCLVGIHTLIHVLRRLLPSSNDDHLGRAGQARVREEP